MKWFANLLIAATVFAIACATMFTLPSHATVFPAPGGSGDRAEEYRCPAGYALSGFHGRSGLWIDQIGLICSELLPDFRLGRLMRLQVKGGIGGSPVEQYCERDSAIRSITVRLYGRPRTVYSIQFSCFRPRDGAQTAGGIVTGDPNYTDRVFNAEPPNQCPGNEYATGLSIRYGGHVNAVGLICAVLAPAAPPITMTGGGDLIEPGMEDNIDRAGADYTRFELDNPKACQIQCKNDSDRCRAWTYVRPGVQGPRAVCYLKTAEGDARANSCCISGVNRKVTGLGKKPGSTAPIVPSTTSPGAMQEPGGFANATARRCKPGFVWREARPADVVCVTPESRSMVTQENAVAPSRWDPNGAYGPNTCIAGFVWREAFDGDVTCVTPERRAAVKEENSVGPSRTE